MKVGGLGQCRGWGLGVGVGVWGLGVRCGVLGFGFWVSGFWFLVFG